MVGKVLKDTEQIALDLRRNARRDRVGREREFGDVGFVFVFLPVIESALPNHVLAESEEGHKAEPVEDGNGAV